MTDRGRSVRNNIHTAKQQKFEVKKKKKKRKTLGCVVPRVPLLCLGCVWIGKERERVIERQETDKREREREIQRGKKAGGRV